MHTCPWGCDCLECLRHGELAAGHVQLKGTGAIVRGVDRALCGVGQKACADVALGHRLLRSTALHVPEQHAL